MADIEWQDEGWNDLIVDLVAESVQAAKMGVKEAAMHLEGAMKRKVTEGSRTGRLYPRPGNTMHQASAPGEPPKSDSGDLRKYMTHSEPELINEEVVSRVGVDGEVIKYARRLELGGYHIAQNGRAVYMAPRPFLRPTFFEQESTVINILERAVGGR